MNNTIHKTRTDFNVFSSIEIDTEILTKVDDKYKKVTEPFLHSLLNKYQADEISFSRLVELINEEVNKSTSICQR